MIARCPYCNSIWVCWNWIHTFGGDREAYEKANPHMKPEDLKNWGHECWVCENCNETDERVENGVPYKLLRLYGFIKYRILRTTDR